MESSRLFFYCGTIAADLPEDLNFQDAKGLSGEVASISMMRHDMKWTWGLNNRLVAIAPAALNTDEPVRFPTFLSISS